MVFCWKSRIVKVDEICFFGILKDKDMIKVLRKEKAQIHIHQNCVQQSKPDDTSVFYNHTVYGRCRGGQDLFHFFFRITSSGCCLSFLLSQTLLLLMNCRLFFGATDKYTVYPTYITHTHTPTQTCANTVTNGNELIPLVHIDALLACNYGSPLCA